MWPLFMSSALQEAQIPLFRDCNCCGGYCGRLRTKYRGAQRGGDPTLVLEKLEFVIGPSAFWTYGEHDFPFAPVGVEDLAKRGFIFGFGEENTQRAGDAHCFLQFH